MSNNVFTRIEQQLTELGTNLPATLALTGASIAVIALGFHLKRSPRTAVDNPKPTAGDGISKTLGMPDLLIAPEQLAHVIKQRRSIFPKDFNGDIVSDKDLQVPN